MKIKNISLFCFTFLFIGDSTFGMLNVLYRTYSLAYTLVYTQSCIEQEYNRFGLLVGWLVDRFKNVCMSFVSFLLPQSSARRRARVSESCLFVNNCYIEQS